MWFDLCMHLKDRRNVRRVKLHQPIKVRPSSPKDGEFEDVSQTENASKRGIYFETPILSYFVGMRVYVTLPYFSQSDRKNREYFGQVIRVEKIENGKRGVAVQIL
jgi:hypothetical protein